jgi:hypothetical protein
MWVQVIHCAHDIEFLKFIKIVGLIIAYFLYFFTTYSILYNGPFLETSLSSYRYDLQ